MTSDQFKQRYALVLLFFTVGWAVFCVVMTYIAVKNQTAVDIVAASGASVLLGALITWMGNVNQFYFRKRVGEDTPNEPDVESITKET